MARALIYKRSVDAVLVDIQLGKVDVSTLRLDRRGIRIKEEPFDEEIRNHDDSSSVGKNREDRSRIASSTVQSSNDVNCNEGNDVSFSICTRWRNKINHNRYEKRFRRSNSSNVVRSGDRSSLNTMEDDLYPNSKMCDVCFLWFNSIRGLITHKRKVSKQYTCKICYMLFQSDEILASHNAYYKNNCKIVNPLNVRYFCHFCDRGFVRTSALQSHLFHQHGDLICPGQTEVKRIAENTTTGIVDTDSADVGTEISPEQTTSRNSIAKILKQPTSERKVNSNLKDLPEETLNSTPQKKKSSRRLNNSCETPSKRMRQTILTDFMSSYNTNERNKSLDHQLETSEMFDDDESKLLQKIEMSTPVKCAETPMSDNKKPFVRIHMYPNLMMSLLNDNEMTSPTTSTTRRSTLYNFRSLNRNSDSLSESRCSRVTRQSSRRQRSLDTLKPSRRSLTLEQKLKFWCKECVIYLERCDKVSNSVNTKSNGSKGVISRQVYFGKVKEELEDPEKTNRENNASLESTEIPPIKFFGDVKPKNELTIPEQQSDLLENDVKSNHLKLFRCNLCKKLFLSQENMREHKKLFHVIYMSSICNARFKVMNALLRHYWQQHIIFRQKKCCVCDEKFSSMILLKQHLTLHCVKTVQSKKDTLPIDVEPNCNVFKKRYRCEGCKKRFLLKSCLTQHEAVCSRMKTLTNDKRQARSLVSEEIDNRKASPVDEKQVSNPEMCTSSEQQEDEVSSKTTLPSIVEKPVENPVKTVIYPPISNDPPLKPGTITSKSPINGMAYAQGYQTNTLVQGTFPCSICDKQFRTFPNLCIHERTFCKPLVNRCNTCNTAFPTKKLLQIHMLATHTLLNTDKYKFVCKFCNQGFTKRMNLQIHERHLHINQIPSKSLQNSDSLFKVNTVCNVCNLMFESYERFVQHNMYYYKEQMFTCMLCPKSFYGMFTLHRHYKLMHRAESKQPSYNYTCDICNEMFNYDSHLHSHKWHVHLHNDSLEQASLNAIQDHSYALTPNMDVSAAELQGLPVRMFGCNICDLHFTNTKDLWIHKAEYSMDGDFHCKICNRRYLTSAVLAKHQSLSHDEYDANSVYTCCICQEVLTTSTSVLCHERHFHMNDANKSLSKEINGDPRLLEKDSLLDTPKGSFSCLICDTKFKTSSDLKVHLLEYSNIGAFSCTVCNRKFSNCYVLEVHKLKHTTLSATMFRHRCPICNEGFTTALNVRPHVLHLHRYESFGSNNVKNHMLAKSSQMNDNVTRSELTMFANSNALAAPSSDESNQSTVNCPECDISFSSVKHLNKHRSRFCNEGNHECPQCGRKFLWITLMQAHLKKHSSKSNFFLKYKCPHCDDKFRSTVAVYSHIVHVHGRDKLATPIRNTNDFNHDDVVVCDSTVTVNEENVAKDADQSKEANTVVETIEEQKDELTSKRLKAHFMLTHFNKTLTEFSYSNVKEGMTCIACGSSFVDQQELDKHMQNKHITYFSLSNIEVDGSEHTNEIGQASSSEQIKELEQASSSEQIKELEQASSSEQIGKVKQAGNPEEINEPEQASKNINEAEQAGNPEKINELEQASTSEQIEEPVQASSSEQIDKPEQVGNPEEIDKPEQAGNPEKINELEQASTSEQIEEPVQASSSEQIDKPEQVGNPEEIDIPEQAGNPEMISELEQACNPEKINEPEQACNPEKINEPEQACNPEKINEPEQTSSSEQINNLNNSEYIELDSSPERHDVDVIEMVWEKNSKLVECVTVDESSNDSDIQMIDEIKCRPSVLRSTVGLDRQVVSSGGIFQNLSNDKINEEHRALFTKMMC
ncbi:Zinc finger protein 91 [Anthophora quadrimaculata]